MQVNIAYTLSKISGVSVYYGLLIRRSLRQVATYTVDCGEMGDNVLSYPDEDGAWKIHFNIHFYDLWDIYGACYRKWFQ